MAVRAFRGSSGFARRAAARLRFRLGCDRSHLFFAAGPSPEKGSQRRDRPARTFNEVVKQLSRALGKGAVEYIPFPEGLREKYQSHTQADIAALRAAGYADLLRRSKSASPGGAGLAERITVESEFNSRMIYFKE